MTALARDVRGEEAFAQRRGGAAFCVSVGHPLKGPRSVGRFHLWTLVDPFPLSRKALIFSVLGVIMLLGGNWFLPGIL